GAWSANDLSTSGKFGLRGFSWQDANISAKDASASGNFSVDPRKVSLSELEGQIFRGSFTGDAEVTNWEHQPQKTVQLKNVRVADEAVEQGSAKFKLRDLSLADALASLGPAFRPVNKLRFAGNVSGTSELRWRQSIRTAEITSALTVSRAQRVA